MNRYTLIERLERKQSRANERGIMDQPFLNYRNAARATRESKNNKIVSWLSTFATIVAAITGLMALLK